MSERGMNGLDTLGLVGGYGIGEYDGYECCYPSEGWSSGFRVMAFYAHTHN